MVCADKNDATVQQWLVNKILAGRYDKNRLLKLSLIDGNVVTIDLEAYQFKVHKGVLQTELIDQGIGVIAINDALGNFDVITAFDEAVNQMADTIGLILD